jgi:hypothetical protein
LKILTDGFLHARKAAINYRTKSYRFGPPTIPRRAEDPLFLTTATANPRFPVLSIHKANTPPTK